MERADVHSFTSISKSFFCLLFTKFLDGNSLFFGVFRHTESALSSSIRFYREQKFLPSKESLPVVFVPNCVWLIREKVSHVFSGT
jgi:hypothetical protein